MKVGNHEQLVEFASADRNGDGVISQVRIRFRPGVSGESWRVASAGS